jgi:formylglycine-generating enzyme
VKPFSSPIAATGIALVFGGIVGAATAISLAKRAADRADARLPTPALVTHASELAGWVDRGLLRLAENELDAEPPVDAYAPDAGVVEDRGPATLTEQRDQLYRTLSFEGGISEARLAEIRAVVEASPYFGQGNPEVTVHPMTRQQCRATRATKPPASDDQRICGSPNMVALYDPDAEDPSRARLCIDQYEFPNIACEYPVVWVRASEASRICRVLDKRLCDAHEWEGACAGKLRPASKEYESYVPRLNAELIHNQARERLWATGYRPDARTCGTGAQKSPGCVDASWEHCGTNSYPAGSFPRCVSPFGVYDLHGNVAEHMNLPLTELQLGSRGGSGETEMKGSWFAFDEYHPHPDDCRWRAPAWHATSVDSDVSHYNYHLGFRCCRDLD